MIEEYSMLQGFTNGKQIDDMKSVSFSAIFFFYALIRMSRYLRHTNACLVVQPVETQA